LREVAEGVLEPQSLSVVDVENLRTHYARTLEHWRHRFTAAGADVTRMSNAAFARAWDLYLAGAQAAFTTGWMQLFQIVFVRGESRRVAWTRV
jgi:cyclopropane-fatty-acyl-phospholipid synthase